jgi:hypothetical protein
MCRIDEQSNNLPGELSQPDDGLSRPNPSATDEIVRRGKHAVERLRRGFNDWLDIAEALQVGRAEGLRAAQTNEPKGPKTSAIAKPKEVNIELREKLLRAEHELSLGGGDLRTADDAPEDIATVMLVKLSLTKAERVARTILKKLNNERAPPVPHREFSAKEVTL